MNKKGFTLVELLAVITLVAILSGLAVNNVVSSINNSHKNVFLFVSKRMVAKAEYLIASSSQDRETAKTSLVKYSFAQLNEDNEFEQDADGGEYDGNATFVKVSYNSTKKSYEYCLCVIGSKRKITNGNNCNYTTGAGCLISDNLTDISVVEDYNPNNE